MAGITPQEQAALDEQREVDRQLRRRAVTAAGEMVGQEQRAAEDLVSARQGLLEGFGEARSGISRGLRRQAGQALEAGAGRLGRMTGGGALRQAALDQAASGGLAMGQLIGQQGQQAFSTQQAVSDAQRRAAAAPLEEAQFLQEMGQGPMGAARAALPELTSMVAQAMAAGGTGAARAALEARKAVEPDPYVRMQIDRMWAQTRAMDREGQKAKDEASARGFLDPLGLFG